MHKTVEKSLERLGHVSSNLAERLGLSSHAGRGSLFIEVVIAVVLLVALAGFLAHDALLALLSLVRPGTDAHYSLEIFLISIGAMLFSLVFIGVLEAIIARYH